MLALVCARLPAVDDSFRSSRAVVACMIERKLNRARRASTAACKSDDSAHFGSSPFAGTSVGKVEINPALLGGGVVVLPAQQHVVKRFVYKILQM